MSSKQPVVNAKDLVKALERKGFYFSRQSGSHAIYANANGTKVTVPIHGKKDMGKGLLKQIMKDAGLNNEDIV
ncbi:MAG: type II toxin-antitoxin system HicA family toxin [Chitinophagaceae bacterium]|nr:type II toxin-antitoxin system HicA family toxin [Chitinophagaceae bacterium]